MAKKKKASATKKTSATKKASTPRSFSGVIRGTPRAMQAIAKALRDVVCEELGDVEERFHGAARPLAMFRKDADVCWIQPHSKWCNLYFARGADLTDEEQILEGSSDRFKYVRLRTLEDIERFPIREWLQESMALNEEAIGAGMNYDAVLDELRRISLALPNTKETLTWGMPHFRVGEKIFCGCGETNGRPRIGLKMERRQSEFMMKIPGIEKAPYSRPGDGWVTIDPNTFDDWDEIEELVVGSFRLIAPKRTIALMDN